MSPRQSNSKRRGISRTQSLDETAPPRLREGRISGLHKNNLQTSDRVPAPLSLNKMRRKYSAGLCGESFHRPSRKLPTPSCGKGLGMAALTGYETANTLSATGEGVYEGIGDEKLRTEYIDITTSPKLKPAVVGANLADTGDLNRHAWHPLPTP